MAQKQRDAGMEGWVARWYARTRQTDMADFRRQARNLAARWCGEGEVLEVAPGPGFFAAELAKAGNFRITGLDISHSFVGLATEHAGQAGVRVTFRQGNVSAMPFADASFDFIYCSAAFKNFAEPLRALDEMHRVLRAGGEAVIADLRKDVALAEIDAYVRESARSAVDGWITRQIFKHMLIKRAYTREAFAQLAQNSRFGGCSIELDTIGMTAVLTKGLPN